MRATKRSFAGKVDTGECRDPADAVVIAVGDVEIARGV